MKKIIIAILIVAVAFSGYLVYETLDLGVQHYSSSNTKYYKD